MEDHETTVDGPYGAEMEWRVSCLCGWERFVLSRERAERFVTVHHLDPSQGRMRAVKYIARAEAERVARLDPELDQPSLYFRAKNAIKKGMTMNKLFTALAVAMIGIGLLMPTAVLADHPEGGPEVAIVYVGNVDRLAATALATANTSDGVETVAVVPQQFDPSTAYGKFLLGHLSCVMAVGGPAANHLSIDVEAIGNYVGGYVEAVGSSRFATAELAGERLADCDPTNDR